MSEHHIKLTTNELNILAHILRHFSDYIAGDDRPDHGFGILKEYRESGEVKDTVWQISGKINRCWYRHSHKDAI